ncbi:AfsR/SARP family transcriptional regulator [Kitasatospora viridis]|uniref:AfsR/SARP family transcriptional regulator n=1 Tax=Kitasatospora viridis TaxID=281105 RepID=UPI00147865D5|nr:BTAD domain-containing putative transcriptional regulator [Kitasatospora viridis]
MGPLGGWHDGYPLDLGRRQQQAFLAMLLAQPGRVLTPAALTGGVFEENRPPNRPRSVLATHAYRLRRELRKVGAERLLVTVDGGYRFDVAVQGVDVGVFDFLVAQADLARAAGERARARDLLAQALALHQGEPLAGLPGRHADELRRHLIERQVTALETKLGLDVELGDNPSCLIDLAEAVFAHPYHERLRAVLMLALRRAGQAAEARAVYAEARRFYHYQGLGRAELDALLARISSPPQRPAAAAAAAPPMMLHQLTSDIVDFTGRRPEVARMTGLLSQPDPPAVVVLAVNGLGGVGKTTLALNVAHTLRDHFSDGRLQLDLRGTKADPLDPAEGLATLLTALGVPDRAVPADPVERAALYRTTVAGRRLLLLLDDASDAAQVIPLLPGARTCAVLVTSRGWLSLLPGAHHLHLDAMPLSEAIDLLAVIVGRARVEAEPQAAATIAAACGLLPLAVRVAGSRLAADPGQPLARLAANLADERIRLAELAHHQTAVEPVLALSYARLSTEQARAMRLVAVPDVPEIALAAAAALLDHGAEEARALLESLVDLNLLQSPAADRYAFHDLVKVFARQQSGRQDTAAAVTAAFARLLDFCLASARNAEGTSARTPDRARRRPVSATTARPGLAFRTTEEANHWMLAQGTLHQAVIRRACRDPELSLTQSADLLDTLGSALFLFGRSHAASVAELAADLATAAMHRGERAGEAAEGAREAEAMARSVRGGMLWHTGRFAQAAAELDRALPLCQGGPEPHRLRARVLHLRGATARMLRKYEEAIDVMTVAAALYRELGDRAAEGVSLGEMAISQAQTGRHAQARATAVRGAELTAGQFSSAEALARIHLGRVLHLVGDLALALTEAEQAGRRTRSLGLTEYQVAAGVLAVRVHLAAGRARTALRLGEELLPLARQASGTLEGFLLETLGEACAVLHRTDRATDWLNEALGRFRQLGLSTEAANVERALEYLT